MKFVLTFFLILIAGAAFGDIKAEPKDKDAKKRYLYEWTDSKGAIHITDGFGKIPGKYRSKARKVESPKMQDSDGAENRAPGPQGHIPAYEPDQGKAVWQQRIRSWKNRLADAEKRYQDLEQERNELLLARGAPALAPIENKMKAEQIEQQMKKLQEQIESAKHLITKVIPEEARKAGVPPGWLRE